MCVYMLFSLIMSMMGTDLHQAKPKIRGPFGRQRQKHSGTLWYIGSLISKKIYVVCWAAVVVGLSENLFWKPLLCNVHINVDLCQDSLTVLFTIKTRQQVWARNKIFVCKIQLERLFKSCYKPVKLKFTSSNAFDTIASTHTKSVTWTRLHPMMHKIWVSYVRLCRSRLCILVILLSLLFLV